MKLKKTIIKLIIASSLVTICNIGTVNANEITNYSICENNNLIKIACLSEGEENGGCKEHKCKIRKRNGMDELKEKGILDDNDIENIRNYYKKNKDKISKEMLDRKIKDIDNMVNEKVITKDKGEKLKSFLKERFEQKNN